MEIDERYMLRALELAAGGIGFVEPNPAVGCVIVKDGQIIGEGFHERFGQGHAEVNALADCARKGNDARGAVMYVSLEPCCHYGKTGPCADVIIEAGIGKVVVAMEDPAEHVNGGGIARLKEAGIEVEVGVCEKEARLLNGPFVKNVTEKKV